MLAYEFLLLQKHGLLGLEVICVFLLIVPQPLFELFDLSHLEQHIQIVLFLKLFERFGLCALRTYVFVGFEAERAKADTAVTS